MRLLSLAAVCSVLLFPLAGRCTEKRAPNIIWIIADDHAAYVCGAYGNKQVKTPNIDKLATQGMRFDQAFCNCPMCTPSRQSFLTGRYPRTIGVTQLKTALPASETTLATMLGKAGYATAAVGKMHFNSNLKHGFDLRIDLAQHKAYLEKKGKSPLPKGVEVLPPWRPFKDPARIWLNSEVRPFGAVDEDMAGTYFARQAVQYLKERKKGQPFFLIVSFYEPHSPFHFPVEFRGRHQPAAFAVPKLGPEDDAQIPAIFRNLTNKEKQGVIAAYFTSVEFMDQSVGIVLQALKDLGLDEDTIVIFFGDHGYMLGQHGRFEKHCLFEPAVRVPLIMRAPRRIPARRHTSALVELIDLVPTVLDYCGEPIPKNVQGQSLVPLLSGKTKSHRDHVTVEYAENEEAMIRTERWHFIYGTGKRLRQDGYATGKPLPGRTIQLYDVQKDPEQLTNLAKRPEHAKLIAAFTKQLAEHMRRTARQPELIPEGDVHAVLEFCLQPRDVGPPKKKGP
jgi:choline-sulfatase